MEAVGKWLLVFAIVGGAALRQLDAATAEVLEPANWPGFDNLAPLRPVPPMVTRGAHAAHRWYPETLLADSRTTDLRLVAMRCTEPRGDAFRVTHRVLSITAAALFVRLPCRAVRCRRTASRRPAAEPA